MRRREFMAAVGGAMAWPVTANAQQAGSAPWTASFVARLRELGWIDRRTVAIEYTERYAEIAAEFVRRGGSVCFVIKVLSRRLPRRTTRYRIA